MKRNNVINFFGILLFIYLVFISSCSPSLGASWYAKSGGKSESAQMHISSIKVKILGKEVEVDDAESRSVTGKVDFTKAKRFAVAVPYEVKELDVDSIRVEAYENGQKAKAVEVNIELEGDRIPLVPNESISVILRIKDKGGRFLVEEKFISVTREARKAVDLVMEKLEAFGNEVAWVEDNKTGAVEVPYSKGSAVTAGDIKAIFKVGDETKSLPVVLQNDEVELKVGEVTSVLCSIEEKQGEYNAYSFTLNCTRLERQEGEEEPLKLKYLSVHGIDARSGLVKVAQDVVEVMAKDVVAVFETFETLPVKLQKDAVSVDSAGSSELEITVEGEKGKYSTWTKTVHVVKEEAEGGDAPTEEDAGGEQDNDQDVKEPEQSENPEDENKNKKFLGKVNVEKKEIDPFDLQEGIKENFGGFSASEFDGWILNMTSMANDNVADYAFKPGAWDAGSPPTCTGDDIGKGQFNHAGNLKYYKYKTQDERWGGRWSPSLDDAEKKKRERFLFFKFTGDAAMNIHLDNSMFCLDTVTKFLFYYSAPSKISSLGVPSEWRDYEEASEGSHVQSQVPFYLTDPVGYVQKDGKCVIYGWTKQRIRKNDYTPSLNQSFRKVASRTPGGHGYSPYKDKIIKEKRLPSTERNPNYTAEKPFIIKHPKAIYATIEDKEFVVSVRAKKAPEGEELSYQWYTNTQDSTEGGVAISGAIAESYEFEKKKTDVFCYCIVTNRNTENGKTAQTASQAVKVRIAEKKEELKIDAKTPIIKKHPEGCKKKFVEGVPEKLTLSIEVARMSSKDGELSYQWFMNTQDKAEGGEKIEDAKSATCEIEISTEGITYYYCEVTNTNEKATGEKTASVVSAVAKVEAEELYELTVSCIGDGTLTVFGGEDVSRVVVGKDEQKKIRVKVGTELILMAKEGPGWEIEKWDGGLVASEDKRTAQLTINSKDDAQNSVGVVFSKIKKQGKLSITAVKVENVSIDCAFWGKHYDFSYFVWHILASTKDDAVEEVSHDLWKHDSYERLYKQGSGKSAYFMPDSNAKFMDLNLNNNVGKLKLDFKLSKRDSAIPMYGDHTWDMLKHEDAPIEFEYDALKDCWRVKDMSYEIDKVTVEYTKNFVLKRRHEKDFAVTYIANNPDLCAVGALKVIYTLSWE